jgi:hypothetical protein
MQNSQKEPSTTPYFLTWMGALVFVTGIIWASVWLMQR